MNKAAIDKLKHKRKILRERLLFTFDHESCKIELIAQINGLSREINNKQE